jgi:hypothetical protein
MVTYLRGVFMFMRLQLVVLGVVVFQGVGLNAMERKSSPRVIKRSALTCSQEARLTDNGNLKIAALKRSIEVSKEEKKDMYDPWPGGNPEACWDHSRYTAHDYMKPWFPH